MFDIRHINIALELFSSLFVLLLILFLLVGDNPKTKLGKWFLLLLVCNMVILLSDAAALAFKGNTAAYAGYVVRISNFLVFSFGYIIMAVFANYLITYLSAKAEIPAWILRLIHVICAVSIALVVLSQFNGMYYIIDQNNMYQRQEWFWLSQVCGIVCMVIAASLVIRCRKKIARRDFIFLLSYIIFPTVGMVLQIMLYGLAFLNIGMTISITAVYLSVQMDQSMQLAESRAAIMLSQIQPHFLYNTLGVIDDLCFQDPDKAHKAILDFSKFLRGNMDSLTKKEPVSFEKELEHTMLYLSLEKLRFEERLTIIYDVQTTEFRLPALTVQPLVENAVRYGIMKKDKGGTIIIRTAEAEDCYRVTIEDDGAGFNPNGVIGGDRSHIGISNVRSRLRVLCDSRLAVNSAPGKGTTVIIEVPKSGGMVKW